MTWIWNSLVEKITIKQAISFKNIKFKLIMTWSNRCHFINTF